MNHAKAVAFLNGHPADVCDALWSHIACEGRAPLEPAVHGLPEDATWQQRTAIFDAIDEALPPDQQPPLLRRALHQANDTCTNLMLYEFRRGFEIGVMMEQIRQTMLRHLSERSADRARDEDTNIPEDAARTAELRAEIARAVSTNAHAAA